MTVIYSREADEDIDNIYAYISNTIGMRGTAGNIVNDILSKIDDLEYFPKRHKKWQKSDYRFFAVGNYMVFYRIDEPAEQIIVERVIYSRRDIGSLL